jgi:predicted homoserine dehydrogenase-like protein
MEKIPANGSRRKFIKQLTGSALAVSVPSIIKATGKEKEESIGLRDYYSTNDNIQVALIGAGGMGTADASTAKTIPGVKIVAACDLFDPRLESAKKNFGADIFTTRDYKEILLRKDIDAVIIGTPDHWHKEISVDALNSGKHE